jgi:hypothetical protein
VAVKADLLDRVKAMASTKPIVGSSVDEKLPESKMNIKNQTAIGPAKNQGPFISLWVFAASGFNSIANQKGPTQRVDSKKETSYRSIALLFLMNKH